MDEVIGEYFHYPISKTPESTKLRKHTNTKYGNLTSLVLVVFLLGLVLINTLVRRGHYLHNNFKILNWCYKKLNNRGRLGEWLKIAIFRIYHNMSTIIQLIFWLTVLSSLSLSELYHGDLIFLSTRLGRVAVNCLPTVLFLTLRPSPLPNTLYLSLIPIHKWLSRFIIFQSVIHTVIYCGYFDFKGTWKKAWKPENIYGWIALCGFLMIFATSISRVRNFHYKLFYFIHYSCTWIIVLTLQFHVRPVKMPFYTAVNLGILIFQIIHRLRMTKISQMGDFKIVNVSPNLLYIEFPNHLISHASVNPGSHIRLTNYSGNPWKRIFKQLIPNYHPFTLVSLPNDFTQKLIIRKGNFKFLDQKYLVTGSYDAKLLFIHNKTNKFQISKLTINTKRILIVVGGSAISFALPILRVMNYHGIPIKIVWVIKDFRDIAILKFFDGYIHGDDFEIFVTGSELIDDSKSMKSYGTFGTATASPSPFYDPERNEIESLLTNPNKILKNRWEDENVDISVTEDGAKVENDDDCYRDSAVESSEADDISSDDSISSNDMIDSQDPSPYSSGWNDTSLSHSLGTTSSSGTNEHFVPKVKSLSDMSRSYLDKYKNTVKKLNISNKIYKGRPTLNHRYYNWCLHEGFTQCSGPVSVDGDLLCCRDLPRNLVSEADASKVWVVSAGPKGLVDNVKLWASENGLKFHEEAFYT